MNLNHLINMVTNQIVRRVVNIAVDRGINFATRKTVKAPTPTPPAVPVVEHDVTTPAELAKEAQLRTLADQAAKTARMARRIGR